MGEILKNVGIGWLTLMVVATIVMLALSVSDGRQATVHAELVVVALLMLPGVALVMAGLLMDWLKRGQPNR